MRLRLFSVFAACWLGGAAGFAQEQTAQKLIILGYDGLDARLTEKWMTEGKLPNFAKLRQGGCCTPCATSNPAQSPVAWACFSTGMNPGKTRIIGFLRRRNTADGPVPEIAMGHQKRIPLFNPPFLRVLVPIIAGLIIMAVSVPVLRYFLRAQKVLRASCVVGVLALIATMWVSLRWLPAEMPVPVSDKFGTDFWYVLAENGIQSTVILAPISFPARPCKNLKLLCGLGTPDLRGTTGVWSFYSSLALSRHDTQMGGLVIPLKLKSGAAESDIVGPASPFDPTENLTTRVRFTVLPDKRLKMEAGGHSEFVGVGEWSDWFAFTFRASPMMTLRGMGRFYLVSVEPSVQVYLTPVNFDPKAPPPTVRISNPSGLAHGLAEEVGPFDTLGWAASTNVLAEEMVDEEAFLTDLRLIMKRRRAIVEAELARGNWQCFVGIFYATDRVQHMMWRLTDEKHPRFDAELADRFGDAILEFYQECDDITGSIMNRYVDENTLLVIVSDHGFCSFRKMVNLNNFLMEEGYLHTTVTRDDLVIMDLFQPHLFFEGVDWSRTQAYAMGLGKIYINLKGRERFGIVPRGEEYEDLCDEIIRKLHALRDKKTGERVVLKAYKREEIRSGPFADEEADIVLGFNDGYRISWQTALGGFGKEVVEPNRRKWSGDHCSLAPSLLPGIFLANRPVADDNIGLLDIAPTVLSYFGLEVPRQMEGRAIAWR